MDSNTVIQRQFNVFGSLTGLGEKHETCIPCKASRNYRAKSLCCFHCFKGKLIQIEEKKKKRHLVCLADWKIFWEDYSYNWIFKVEYKQKERILKPVYKQLEFARVTSLVCYCQSKVNLTQRTRYGPQNVCCKFITQPSIFFLGQTEREHHELTWCYCSKTARGSENQEVRG